MSQETSIFDRNISSIPTVAAALLLLVCALPSPASAAGDRYRFRAGVHISREHPLTQKQSQRLLKGLRFWTGLTEIGIDENEHLILGDSSRVTGGSAAARKLIIAAAAGEDSFTLENRDHSPTVAFAQLETTLDYFDATGHHGVWQLRIDFSDFTGLRGDATALASFDPAINMLHELAHGVLKLPDPVSPEDQLGECERYINRVRAELGMPERLTYSPRNRRWPAIASSAEAALGDLIFFLRTEHTHKKKTLLVTFNVDAVCEVRKSRSIDRSKASAMHHRVN